MLIPLTQTLSMVAPAVPRYPYSNSLYIHDDIPALIDAGSGGTALADVPKDAIRFIYISHFHFDHLHSNVLFPNAGMLVGQEELPTYRDEKEYLRFHGYDRWQEIMGFERQMYGTVLPLPEDVPVQPGFRELPVVGTFSDGETLCFGQTSAVALHLPGHTAGHYGFYFPEDEILFSGDIDLVATGPWYNSASGNVGSLIRSVQRIRELHPRVIVSSHRRILTENLIPQLDRYIGVVLEREEKVYELLKRPHTLNELAAYCLTYPNARNMYDTFWEKMTMVNHLNHLIENGRVRQEGDHYIAE
ncbi:MAG: MBL fold metallo-hydrolase [Solirubrobacterales bacterium]